MLINSFPKIGVKISVATNTVLSTTPDWVTVTPCKLKCYQTLGSVWRGEIPTLERASVG